jgi:fluoride ion exporter CrcB/FEX
MGSYIALALAGLLGSVTTIACFVSETFNDWMGA